MGLMEINDSATNKNVKSFISKAKMNEHGRYWCDGCQRGVNVDSKGYCISCFSNQKKTQFEAAMVDEEPVVSEKDQQIKELTERLDKLTELVSGGEIKEAEPIKEAIKVTLDTLNKEPVKEEVVATAKPKTKKKASK